MRSKDEVGRSIEIVDRREYLPERARGQRVVHLGCVDEHLTTQRAGTGDLLHQELAKVATTLLGVDLSSKGLAEIERLVPGRYLQGDVEQLDELDLPEEVDLVIAAEIIEHLGNPARFLDRLAVYLSRTGAVAVITTPNAYSWRHVLAVALRRPEQVHEDHRLLYSLATLRRSLTAAGLEAERVLVHTWQPGAGARSRLLGAIDRALLRWQPLLAVGLVVEVRPTTRDA